ncbi:PGF-CTERM sorting domain-containing protein [Halorubrum salsamenti]|uniref:PGF-CTERM sorting domain-containing protein n=1 Tax=Halorubrum salsamenti TaxID=2583990 RepID=UPI00119CF2F6|nr:PGF-CTERM sorting domain-containing protein [Halorubrum salsamenti]
MVRSISDGAVTISVDGVNGEGYDFSVGLAGPSEVQEVSLSTLTIDPAEDQEAFEATVGRPRGDPGARAAVPRGTVLGYVNITSTLDATDTGAATLEFAVNDEALPDRLGPEDVAVMRYADGEWTTTDVTHETTEDGHRVTLPHAAPVAVVALGSGNSVALESSSIEVVDAELLADQVRAGYETTLRATVRNTGDAPANRTLTVTIDDESVAEREVALAPNETVIIRIGFTPSESGTVSLDGDEIGSIDLFVEDDAASPATETEESVPGFGPVVAVVALLVATLALRANRQ